MEFKAVTLKESSVDMDARTFEGYAATWDLDQVADVIHPGAFSKSIREAFPAKRIKVLWQHRDPIGIPIEMREDEKGLWVKGRISKTALGDEALELMRDEVVDRMSIGFSIPAGKAEMDGDGIRHIKEVKLMEFSPVTFPANEAAVITGVKQIHEALRCGVRLEDSEPLLKALADLQALIKGQPGQPTATGNEPPDLKGLLSAFENLSGIARNH